MAMVCHNAGLLPIVEIVGGLGAGGTDARVLCCWQWGQEGATKPV